MRSGPGMSFGKGYVRRGPSLNIASLALASVSRVGATTTTSNFILDGEDLARTTTAGTATLYAFSPEGLMASSTSGSARFYLKDLHGDTVGAVNASGSVMGAKLYSPWGEPAASAGESYSAGFLSQPTDADTGYVDMTTRLYAPTQGRFTSRDVLFGDTNSPSSMNQYGYAEGNPVTMWDPSGMKCSSATSGPYVGSKACLRSPDESTQEQIFPKGSGWTTASSAAYDSMQIHLKLMVNHGGDVGSGAWVLLVDYGIHNFNRYATSSDPNRFVPDAEMTTEGCSSKLYRTHAQARIKYLGKWKGWSEWAKSPEVPDPGCSSA